MTLSPAHNTVQGFAARLARTRTGVRAVMVIERAWPLVLPLVIVASLFLSLSWLGVFRVLPDAGRLAVMAVLGVAAIGALYPLRFYRHPSADEVDRRIERANRLDHTPVRAQNDRPSGKENAFADALWREALGRSGRHPSPDRARRFWGPRQVTDLAARGPRQPSERGPATEAGLRAAVRRYNCIRFHCT